MSDADLIALAEAAGLAPRWRDAFGKMHDVAPEVLRAVLAALGTPAGSDAEVADSRGGLQHEEGPLPPLLTADAGQPIAVPAPAGRFRLTLEDGTRREGRAEPRALLPAIDVPGYHALELGDIRTTLAVAPAHGFLPEDAAPGRKLWGLAVQLYALRRAGDGGIGDFSALRRFVATAGARGAAAVAISPVHAQFSADADRFSPYAPSSRVMLNVLHADAETIPDAYLPARPEQWAALEAGPMVDWPAAGRLRLAHFRRVFDRFAAAPRAALHEAFDAFRAEQGDLLESHARFEALHAHVFGADATRWNWRDWPEEYRSPDDPAVARFAHTHAREVAFHAFLQFLADRGSAAAQQAARAAGMPIGLISDLAVGTDLGGSHAWSRQDQMLMGLTIGAPPDVLNTQGQNWGITAFSPAGLQRHGYAGFLEMLRAALRHAGGVRIDHAMGLTRLWVVPEGASPQQGAYLRFPSDDLLRLLALESHRHRAVVLGEDLGTVPEGFQDRLGTRGVMGLRVLWFESDDDGFRPPGRWTRRAVAMTSTHDLPTVAGWWSGRDLALREELGLLGDDKAIWFEHENRARDRVRLWEAFRGSRAGLGEVPPPEKPEPAVDAAIRHVGAAGCELALLPVEDALGLPDQPNLPGTLHEHPNWQRRLALPADRVLDDPAVAARLASLAEARQTAEGET